MRSISMRALLAAVSLLGALLPTVRTAAALVLLADRSNAVYTHAARASQIAPATPPAPFARALRASACCAHWALHQQPAWSPVRRLGRTSVHTCRLCPPAPCSPVEACVARSLSVTDNVRRRAHTLAMPVCLWRSHWPALSTHSPCSHPPRPPAADISDALRRPERSWRQSVRGLRATVLVSIAIPMQGGHGPRSWMRTFQVRSIAALYITPNAPLCARARHDPRAARAVAASRSRRHSQVVTHLALAWRARPPIAMHTHSHCDARHVRPRVDHVLAPRAQTA